MKQLVEFPLMDGNNIIIEISEPEVGGTIRVGRSDKIAKAKETFEEAFGKILPVATSVFEKLQAVSSRPDEIEVTFGVNLGTECGAFIASASAEANFGVTLRWSRKS
jgi:hypothetical protein